MGLLSKVSPAVQNTDILLYEVPVGFAATVNVSVVNRSPVSVPVWLAVMTTSDLTVASLQVADQGSGCTTIPSLSVVGENTTRATAVVEHMGLATITISNAGTGYQVDDELTIDITGATTVASPKVKVVSVDESGAVTSVSITDPGRLTTLGTVATATGGSGTDITFNIMTFGIRSVTLTEGGNGYKVAPTVVATDGIGFTVTAQMAMKVEDDDYFEVGDPLPPKAVLERTGLPLSAGQCLFIKTGVGGSVNAHVWGFQKVA